MIAILLTFLATTAFYVVLAWFCFQRVLAHLRVNPEAARLIAEHILIPAMSAKPNVPKNAARQTADESSEDENTQ
ncbi:hypothetical protein [Fimbriiglobus ruber]|uniref:Uncharacterized protein n=1 Tax=Fimbriiglobus ruber TaxID=1908690 RepID=A0A225DWP6_9BACT|nr:hypothetical protein [Fimbriiglobus ruber]OWK42096.1 hypothetical protein FRUB_04174 [Fimbriiglobus ruber]